MLDNPGTIPGRQDEWAVPAQGEAALVRLSDVIAGFRRSFWLIAACVVLSSALAALYVVRTPPAYVASAQLMIEAAKQQMLWHDSSVVDLTVDNAQVESQVEVLRSERIAEDVISSLGLANDPEFRSDSESSEYERARLVLSRFQNALSTRRLGQSYVIEISFRSTDAEKAARIANAVPKAYMRDLLRAKTEVAQEAGRWMEARVTELGVQLNAAAAAVQKFRAANGIIDTGGNNQTRLLDQLTELEARAQAYRKLYENFVQRLTESRQQESYPVSNARVIAAASTPLAQSYPRTRLIMLLSVLLGLLAGAGISAARSTFDDKVRRVRDIRQSLGLDCLASLPRFAEVRDGQPANYRRVLRDPFSPFANGIRGLKLSMQSASQGKAGLHIGVISLAPGEGKTTVAVSLAALFAISGSKTLLIDADLRHPSISRSLAPGAKHGLIEALVDGAERGFTFDPGTGTHILAAMYGDQIPDSAELLSSPAMKRLLQGLRAEFTTVVVDLPSLKTAVDARAVGPLLDGCVLVVEWGRTSLEALGEAVELLRTQRIRVFGAVINKVEDGFPSLFGLRLADLPRLSAVGQRTRPVQAGSP